MMGVRCHTTASASSILLAILILFAFFDKPRLPNRFRCSAANLCDFRGVSLVMATPPLYTQSERDHMNLPIAQASDSLPINGRMEDSDNDVDFVPRRRLFQSSSSSSVSTSTITRRRRYVSKTRVVRSREKSKRHLQWMNMLTLSDNDIRLKKCCSSLHCFRTVDLRRLRQSMTSVFSSSRATRRTILSQMLTSSGNFFFDGRRVCSVFLVEAFKFSTDLQSSVRSSFAYPGDTGGSIELRSVGQHTDGSPCSEPTSHVYSDSVRPINCNTGSLPYVEREQSMKRDAIITFLNRTATSLANLMPDNVQRHLPYVNKITVFRRFIHEFKILYPTTVPPSENYFYAIWKKHCSDIKVRKATRFTKCATCERIRKALLDAIARNLPTDDILQEQAAHHEFIYNERLEYKSKTELAKLRPLEYLSIVVDGADQSAYVLPHFVFDIKGVNGFGMKVHLIGLLQHAQRHVLNLFTMTDEHQKGSNHIIEVVHRFLNRKATEGPLPKKLFIQMDNCTRENKNKFVMSYLDALVRWGVFDEIEAGFLPVGHTHCDVDQAFSSTSNRLDTHDAITLEDMHNELRTCYNENTVVVAMKQVVNWRGLCDETNCCNPIDHITHYRFFKFCVSQAAHSSSPTGNITAPAEVRTSVAVPTSGAVTYPTEEISVASTTLTEGPNSANNRTTNTSQTFVRTTTVMLRHTSRDNWIPMASVNSGISSFLRYLPDLRQTPPEVVTSPDDRDEITARIESESQRIDSEEKLQSLFNLRDEIFRSRSSNFHWNLSNIVELKALNMRRAHMDVEIEVATLESTGAPSLSARLRYDMGHFVAVKGQTADNSSTEVWVGRIVDRIKHSDGTVRYLEVHWYEQYGDGDMLTGKYRPWFLRNKSTKRKNVPWLSNISCDTVINCFPTLTSNRKLPVLVANDLRERIPSTART